MEFLRFYDVEFCPTSRETPEPPGDRNSDFLSFLAFVAKSCSGLLGRDLRSRDTSGTVKASLRLFLTIEKAMCGPLRLCFEAKKRQKIDLTSGNNK